MSDEIGDAPKASVEAARKERRVRFMRSAITESTGASDVFRTLAYGSTLAFLRATERKPKSGSFEKKSRPKAA
jgi:hypothetical protein